MAINLYLNVSKASEYNLQALAQNNIKQLKLKPVHMYIQMIMGIHLT